MHILSTIVALLVALLVVNLAWRWASRRYQLPCPTWLAWGLEGPIMTRLLGTRSTLDAVDLRPGQRVLEIGCGPGRLLLPAARRISPGGEAVGVDIQTGMIERLEAAARAKGLANVRGIAADATTIELPAESFDVVLVALTLGEIPRREIALQRAYDVLKPGGVLAITELFPDPHFVSHRTVRRLAANAGFHHATTRGMALFFTASFVKPSDSTDVRDEKEGTRERLSRGMHGIVGMVPAAGAPQPGRFASWSRSQGPRVSAKRHLENGNRTSQRSELSSPVIQTTRKSVIPG